VLRIKSIGLFASGLLCGLIIHWLPSTSINAFGGGSPPNGGIASANCPADIAPTPNGDGIVDVDDLLAVINGWGPCPIVDADGDGFSVQQGDCDDTNPLINPNAAELCNAIDDNCNGDTDEGFNLGQPCLAGAGACLAAGTIVCDGNGGAICSAIPGTPSLEICNGIDDDCDGQVDEGLGLDEPCFAGVGACMTPGTIICDGDGGTICSAIPGKPSSEVCEDGIDNDCDGFVDEDCP
jgi:hypothetical protein